jgi:hypothetical protein
MEEREREEALKYFIMFMKIRMIRFLWSDIIVNAPLLEPFTLTLSRLPETFFKRLLRVFNTCTTRGIRVDHANKTVRYKRRF